MNNRIKELAKQAGTWEYFNAEDEKTKAMDEQALQNFAELLLDNVLDVVEQAKNDPFVSLDDAKRMAHFVNVTKKKINKTFRS